MDTLQRVISMLIGAAIVAYLLSNVRNQRECVKEEFQGFLRSYFRESLELTEEELEAGLATL